MKTLLFTLLFSAPLFANELTLHVVPSPGIDWSSPSALLKSSVKNKVSLKEHIFGDVFAEVNCAGRTDFLGMKGDTDFVNRLVWEGNGLGVFFQTFPGSVENTKPSAEKMNYVKFKLSEGQCGRLVKFVSELKNKNVARNFGLAHRPRHGEGASGASLGVSLADVLNILDQDMKESWMETLQLPEELIGKPIREERVSIFTLLNANTWTKDGDKFLKITFWNPDRMYKWINEKIQMKQAGYSVEKSGVVFDKSHFPVPQEPVWLQQLDPADKKKTAVIIEPSRPPKKISAP